MTQKRRFSTTFFTKQIIFVGFRWNISTSEPVLERLLNFWSFQTYLTKISHPVQHREPLEVKKLKIVVARKLDLIEPNWVYSFSSLIRFYQTHIVSPMLVSMIFNLLDRVILSNLCSKYHKIMTSLHSHSSHVDQVKLLVSIIPIRISREFLNIFR
jgi:hypothetical protein